MVMKRSLSSGAEVFAEGVSFRVWAPGRKKVELVIDDKDSVGENRKIFVLEDGGNGYFSLLSNEAAAGKIYWFRLDGSEKLYPDPASRFQPDGPHGPSEIIDPNQYVWSDEHWEGPAKDREVIYEMHIGTFTKEGTYKSAEPYLPELADLGITVIEMMPVADFPGKFGWGYDGVNLFAPTRLYGRPDDLRDFINSAHKHGVAVILDVVYNHFGPDGNYLREFSPFYFSKKYQNDWGDAINFDGPESEEVRNFFVDNAGYWIDEFHFDGLRLDATQDIHDTSSKHIIAEITAKVREKARRRRAYIIGENEPQQVKLLKPYEEGGYAIDALWNDDFHHTALVALTGKSEAYYTDYRGTPQEFISSIKYGFLFQGQYYKWQKKNRGSANLHSDQGTMIHFIENHDQVANSGRGQRVHELCSPGIYRAMTAVMVLGQAKPLFFQGQEFASSKPFNYFADHYKELTEKICAGRKEFLSQFRSIASPEMLACMPDPGKADTFNASKLDHEEKKSKGVWLKFHKELLSLRRNDRAFSGKDIIGIDGAVLGMQAFLIRYFLKDGADRIMLVNLGIDLNFEPSPEPLLAPPEGMEWEMLWSSEDPDYGGNGVAPFGNENWIIPGHSTTIFKPIIKRGRINGDNNPKDESK